MAHGCGLRFPAGETDAPARCPRCGGPLVATAELSRDAHDAHPAAAPTPGLSALLDNIRSIHNAGSMFRSADGAGLDRLYLCGITATPEHPRFSKAALGAETVVDWAYAPHAPELAGALRERGHTIWSLERVPGRAGQQSLLDQTSVPLPLILVVGNEKAGVDPTLLDLSDGIYSLPMRGRKSSLNAAVAFGIAAYHLGQVVARESSQPTE